MADIDIKGIESILKDIKEQTGGFKRSAGESLENGIKKVVGKIEDNTSAIKNLKNVIENSDSNGNSRNFGTEIGNIAGYLKTISNAFRGRDNIAEKIDDLNDSIEYALRSISNNHTTSASNSSNGASSNFPLNNIDRNVQNILTELTVIKNTILAKKVEQDNEELKNILTDNALRRAKSENIELKRNEKIDEAKERYYNAKTKKEKDEARRDYQKALKDKKKDDIERKPGDKYGPVVKAISGELSSLISEKPSASKLADKGVSAISSLGGPGAIVGGILQAVKALLDLGAKQDIATTAYARAIGGNVQSKYNVGETVRGLNSGWNRKGAYGGYRAEDAYSALTEYAEARGRTTERQSQESVRSLIDLKRFGIGMESINNFDTFGKSIEQTDRYFAQLYNEVSKKGLSFKNVSKAVNDNLKAAQSHTFANGLRGLEQMAERSVQLKYNMQQVFQFADKISEVEGAIETAANLSVLGGGFAQYSNPMQLLYEGLNDSEALQKRIEGMFGDKAFWNNETKQIDMSAMDKEFVKQAAKAAGLDPNEMLNISYNNARLQRIENQIKPGLREDTANYIKNIAELDENGRGYVNINGQNKFVSELSEEDRELLKKESELKDRGDKAKLGDIYMETSNISEKMDNVLSYLQEKLGRWVFGLFQRFARNENNRQEAVANSTADERLRERRMQYYNEHSLEHGNFWNWIGGGRKKFTRDLASGVYDSELPKSPIGFGPLRGNSHLNGGIIGLRNGIPWEAEDGETLIDKLHSKKYNKELWQIQNGTFNPYTYANDLVKNNMSQHMRSMNVLPSQSTPNSANVPNSLNMGGKITIAGMPSVITFKSENGVDLGNMDPKALEAFKSMLTLQIIQEWQKQSAFSGFDKESFPYKNVIFNA